MRVWAKSWKHRSFPPKAPAFHAGNAGSSPAGVTNYFKGLVFHTQEVVQILPRKRVWTSPYANGFLRLKFAPIRDLEHAIATTPARMLTGAAVPLGMRRLQAMMGGVAGGNGEGVTGIMSCRNACRLMSSLAER